MAAFAGAALAGVSASDLLRRSANGFGGVPLRTLGRTSLAFKTRDFAVSFSMKKKDIPISKKISDDEIEAEIHKLKQQILEAKGSSAEPPKLDSDDTPVKLKREVDNEYYEAVKAIGLIDRFSKLKEEVTNANSEDQIDPLLKDKIEKLNTEIAQGLPAAPNYGKLQQKLGMFKELSEVKHQSDKNLEQELQTIIEDVWSSPRIKENYETLKGEIRSIGASAPSDLDDELKKKINDLRKEVNSQLANALRLVGIEFVPVRAKSRENSDEVSLSVFESEIEELNKYIENIIEILKIEELSKDVGKEIENSVNSSDIKSMIEALNLEVAKAGETPDEDSKNRIAALEQQIKQSLLETVDLSKLKDKYENPVSKVSSEKGSLKKPDPTDFFYMLFKIPSENGSLKTAPSNLSFLVLRVSSEKGRSNRQQSHQ